MTPLLIEAYRQLIRFDCHLARENFATIYETVRSCPVEKPAFSKAPIESVCHAMDLACVWYWKEVLCLQRSAAATCLLRRHGVPAKMVLGAKQMPFKAHAWVEVNGGVIGDKPYMREIYGILDRC
jgi:transglutaminase superfamily protein